MLKRGRRPTLFGGLLILGVLAVVFGILPFFFFDMMSDWASLVVGGPIIDALNGVEVGP